MADVIGVDGDKTKEASLAQGEYGVLKGLAGDCMRLLQHANYPRALLKGLLRSISDTFCKAI